MNRPTCTCKDCLDKAKNQEKHLNHPFYQEVKAFADEIEHEQILKGAEKYKEPFIPDHWSIDELAVHGMQELRDGQVYITGMRDRMRKQEKEIERLTLALKEIGSMHTVGFDPEYVVKRYAEYAREVLINGK